MDYGFDPIWEFLYVSKTHLLQVTGHKRLYCLRGKRGKIKQ